MRLRIFLLVFLWTTWGAAQPIDQHPGRLKIVDLPTAAEYPGQIFAVQDGDSATDCSTGLSTYTVLCQSKTTDGVSWAWSFAGVSVSDTGPSPDCSGSDTYQDGEGNCDEVGGDLSGGLDAAVVGDNSHAHTTTTLSGILAADMGDADHGDVSWLSSVAAVEDNSHDHTEANVSDLSHTAAFSPTAGVSTDHGAGAVVALTDMAYAICGASGKILETTGVSTWACITTPTGAAPAGSDGDVQIKSGSSFAASVMNDDGTDVTVAAPGQILMNTGFPPDGGYSFAGDPDTAIYSNVANQIRILAGGLLPTYFDVNGMWMGSGKKIYNAAYYTFSTDSDTYFVLAGTDTAQIYAGNLAIASFQDTLGAAAMGLTVSDDATSQVVYVSPAAGNVVAPFVVGTMATAPATCLIGALYTDTSGAYCGCTATNTWENLSATGACT